MTARPILWAEPAAAAEAVRSLCPDAAAAAAARADEICARTFLFRDHWEMEPTAGAVRFDGPVQWDAIPAGDPEWTYALNRHTIFVNLGKAWRCSGRACYLEAFAALLADWLERVPRTPESETSTWRALEAGLRPENWLRALALFGPAVPEALRRRADASLAEHGAYLEKAHGPFQRLSNWGAIQAHGLFLTGLWLGRADWQALALERLRENLHNAVGPDGVQWEQSPMYHCEVLHAVLDTLLLARQNGVAVPLQLEEKARAMCRALAVWAAPDRAILPQGDSDVIDAGDLLAAGALLFGDPLLAAAARGPCVKKRCGTLAPTLRRAWPRCRRPGPNSPRRRWRPAATTCCAPAGGGRMPTSISAPAASAAGTGTRTFCTSTYTTAARPC